LEVRATTPMIAYSTMVANMYRWPIHWRGMPSFSRIASATRNRPRQALNHR
jgi:hypothetical protein